MEPSPEYRYLPCLHPGRLLLLVSRFNLNRAYYSATLDSSLGVRLDTEDGGPTVSQVNEEIGLAYPENPEFLWDESMGFPPGESGYLDFGVAFQSYDVDESQVPHDVKASVLGEAWLIWKMYRLALLQTVELCCHFKKRGRPSEGGE